MPEVTEDLFCITLPKVELHAHFNGSLSAETLQKLSCPPNAIAKYQELTTKQATSRTLDECFELFSVAHHATSTIENVTIAVSAVIEEFYKDNCIYLELRTTPREEQGMSKEEYLETIIRAIDNNPYDIIVKLILCLDRRHDEKHSHEVLKMIIAFKKSHPNIIVGVDLCGNPNEGLFPLEIFENVRENGLKVTLHCAEVKNELEVLKMLNFKPDRIGHGTFLRTSETILKKYGCYPIPLECCLTSNIICGTVKKFENHHLKYWIENNLPFSLGTDDKGVFCTTLSQEYSLAKKYFHLTNDQLWNVVHNSLDYAFCSDQEKIKLKTRLNAWKNKSTNFF